MDSTESTGYVIRRPRPEKAADRFNSGKTRYDLIPPGILKILAQVYSNGALKYEDDNWKGGLSFRSVLDSAKRHVEAFRAGEDVDRESGLHTLAHAAWNYLTIVDYGQRHPEYDDREFWWLNPKKVGFDIDGVLCAFDEGFSARLAELGLEGASERFATHWNSSYGDDGKGWDSVMGDHDFWLNLAPMIHGPSFPFEPDCYITNRSFQGSTKVTKKWIERHGFPAAKVISTKDKVQVIKDRGLDIFVDDRFENFQQINTHTTCVCYLLSRPYNEKFPVGSLRIYDLDELQDIVYANG
jgi:hypothetical protein